jgi:coproporphyrinogen III oxidase-like Fe-S oxidoreductase
MEESSNYYPSTSDEVNLDLIYEDPETTHSIFLSSQSAAYNLDLL